MTDPTAGAAVHQPEPGPTPPAAPDATTNSVRRDAPTYVSTAEFRERTVVHFVPPDLWNNPRPSLKSTWMWACHGQHLPDHPTFRAGSRGVAMVTLPLRAVLVYLDWLIERPTRLLALGVLATVVVRWIA